MSEYRYDPVQGHWVIIAANRSGRPDEFLDGGWHRVADRCPFCAGNEAETPPELARYHVSGEPSWQVRVVPNKYPAVVDCPPRPRQSISAGEPLPGYGIHEVIIESPIHIVSLTQLSEPAAQVVLQAYQDRLANLRQRGDTSYGVIFKNVGAAAGASLEHLHSQLLATALLPPPILERLQRWQCAFHKSGRTVVETWLHAEQQQGNRVVAVTENFAAICPFASRMPYEIRIAPLRPAPYFEGLTVDHSRELAGLLLRTLRSLERVADQLAYNMIIHTAPFSVPPHGFYHWYIEILPRLTRAAGFEWGTGCFINPVEPERAAEQLRQAAATVGTGQW